MRLNINKQPFTAADKRELRDGARAGCPRRPWQWDSSCPSPLRSACHLVARHPHASQPHLAKSKLKRRRVENLVPTLLYFIDSYYSAVWFPERWFSFPSSMKISKEIAKFVCVPSSLLLSVTVSTCSLLQASPCNVWVDAVQPCRRTHYWLEMKTWDTNQTKTVKSFQHVTEW